MLLLVEKEGQVLVVKRIHVSYCLRVAPDKREAAARAHEIHVDYCPMARSIRGCIDITTSLGIEDANE